jgi:hypothetical protein
MLHRESAVLRLCIRVNGPPCPQLFQENLHARSSAFSDQVTDVVEIHIPRLIFVPSRLLKNYS